MVKKAVGLSQSTKVREVVQEEGRTRGKGEQVALTLRLRRSDWERLHQLAMSEGTSIQRLAVRGLSMVFEEKGLQRLVSP